MPLPAPLRVRELGKLEDVPPFAMTDASLRCCPVEIRRNKLVQKFTNHFLSVLRAPGADPLDSRDLPPDLKFGPPPSFGFSPRGRSFLFVSHYRTLDRLPRTCDFVKAPPAATCRALSPLHLLETGG